jgi:chemotaxis protein methyltransferase CheR
VYRPVDHDAELYEEEFRLLRDFIHERFGLYFDDAQRASLRGRLAGRLQSLDLPSYEDYYQYLRFSPQRNEELGQLVTHLTNNETYFYRESPQLQVFADPVLRMIKDRKGRAGARSLRILSAGCSTGEEALTLAMIVYDSGHFFWGWDVHVLGVDVDEAVLEKARKGLYHTNSFRGVPPATIERHFVRQGTATQPKEAVRKLVSFRQGNLLEIAGVAGPEVDVVFCRNVLIYFSDGAILKAVRQFFEILRPGGYLFLGHAESLSRVTDIFTPVRFQGAMVYQKPEPPAR